MDSKITSSFIPTDTVRGGPDRPSYKSGGFDLLMLGGIILFILAMSMLNAEESPIKQTPEEQKERQSDMGAIVPLAIPIMAGPGALSSIIVSVNQFPGLLNQLIISASAIGVALVMCLLLYFATSMERMLGKSGINIINRIGGLILAAIAMQTLANGVLGLFPILGSQL